MALKVAINGFGRIGRNVLRALIEADRRDLEVVAINDLATRARSKRIGPMEMIIDHGAGFLPFLSGSLLVILGSILALKGFFRFCVESEYLDRDPAAVLRTPKKRSDHMASLATVTRS